MEPAIIDWKMVDSRYVRDEAYENINAPMWLDLAAPNDVPVDDIAWFCQPGNCTAIRSFFLPFENSSFCRLRFLGSQTAITPRPPKISSFQSRQDPRFGGKYSLVPAYPFLFFRLFIGGFGWSWRNRRSWWDRARIDYHLEKETAIDGIEFVLSSQKFTFWCSFNWITSRRKSESSKMVITFLIMVF